MPHTFSLLSVTVFHISTSVIITGASKGGLGAETALSLATPTQIILAGRTESKITPVSDEIISMNPAIRAQFVKLDLSDHASIRKIATEILGLVNKIDLLFNNAGIMAVENFETIKDGIENHFGANHIGHFLLTNLLLGKLAKGGRVVNVTSMIWDTKRPESGGTIGIFKYGILTLPCWIGG